MQIEHFVSEKCFVSEDRGWDIGMVTLADNRYCAIVNRISNDDGERTYIPPTDEERKRGFCTANRAQPPAKAFTFSISVSFH